MKKTLFLLFITLNSLNISSQNTAEDVYAIFQNNCMPCHNNATQTANLDLEGFGANATAKMLSVYNNLYKQTPNNTAATAAKNFLIYPGDPYRSFLYRKIDDGLTAGLTLHAGEGTSMPNNNSSLDEKEIELIRQWILYGAQSSGEAFDKTLLEDYYDNGGIESIANPPAPPVDGEGFQIHLGPFYLEAGGEIEYFSKYELLLDNDIEIYKFKTVMGDYSHHYISYKFSSTFGNNDPNLTPYGMREGQDFDGKEFVSVDQYSGTLNLPEGSAFLWEQNTVMDLNTHYINYSNTQVLKCEVYFNVYTQDLGTANQIMEVILIPNTDIPIPNDNVPVTFNYDFNLAADLNIYVWGLTAHTHKYGKDFNLYKKLPNGNRGEQIYDAGCGNGIPNCNLEDFDYSHLPLRFYSPFETVNVSYGIEAEATFQNDGPVPVDWGFTSEDEMMIFIAFYVTDTTGVDMNDGGSVPIDTTGINSYSKEKLSKVFPKPANNFLSFEIEKNYNFSIEIFDVTGKKIFSKNNLKNTFKLAIANWNKGLYYYLIKSENQILDNGKFIKK